MSNIPPEDVHTRIKAEIIEARIALVRAYELSVIVANSKIREAGDKYVVEALCVLDLFMKTIREVQREAAGAQPD